MAGDHNVAELGRVPRKQRDRLAAPQSPAWLPRFHAIPTRHSWGAPAGLRDAIRAGARAAQ